MSLFRRKARRSGRLREADRADLAHLEEFARTRRGVEGFVEPRTAVTDTTMVLVAIDGEWTRRRVPGPKYAHEFANGLGIPSYDAAVVGYPRRMREWNARRAEERRQTERRLLDGES
ncbi:MAG: hypothetical protein J2P24_19860 [Streptosporangiales bacterium]|nr:hypothetical protein [Streptosporangiales bacterium]